MAISSSTQRAVVSALFGFTLFAVPLSAHATATFPGVINDTLKLSYTPPCSLCHEGGKTGSGTVTTRFGVAARTRGLVPNDEGSLRAALAKIEAEKLDSDSDGTTDIQELRDGTDPSSAGGAALDVPPQVYGCGASIAGASDTGTSTDPTVTWMFAGLLGLIGMTVRRKKFTVSRLHGASIVLLGLALPSCYDVSYVASDKCASGATWTGGDSELMKPGQACIECHSRKSAPRFEFAGSVMKKLTEHDDCIGVSDVQVRIIGADGIALDLSTNETGNFRTSKSLKLPYTAQIMKNGAVIKAMTTKQTSGDCNSCHTEKGANSAPGRLVAP